MKGQALVESLFTYLLIFLTSFCVIEIARLQAFKMLLQISVNYYAKYLALDEMKIIRNHEFILDSKKIISSHKIESQLKKFIADDLALMGTSLFSFDHNTKKLSHHTIWVDVDLLAQQTSQSPPGIHIKAQTCLPVLFSGFFNSFLHNLQIGRAINDPNHERNCLGEFIHAHQNENTQTPLFWFRIRAATYSPWPSSTQIFYKGFAMPQKIRLIEAEQYKKFLDRISEINIQKIFKNSKTYDPQDRYEKKSH